MKKSGKKVLSFLLTLAMALSLAGGGFGLSAASAAEEDETESVSTTSDTDWYYADTDATEFCIGTAEELLGLAELVNSKTEQFNDKTIYLTADIDMSDCSDFAGIGTNTVYFYGNFNGMNHTVTLNIDTDNTPTGLFCSVGWGTIKNVIIDGSVTSTGYNGTGALIGDASSETVLNCENRAEVSGRGYVGGLIGMTTSYGGTTRISGCSNSGTVTDTSSSGNTGGIVGEVVAYDGAEITGCTNTGTIIGTDRAGGIVGAMDFGEVTDCTNSGDVFGSYGAGGIVGMADSTLDTEPTVISDCTNSGAISATDSTTSWGVGGIVGFIYGGTCEITVSRCGNSGEIDGNMKPAGGIIGRLRNYSSSIKTTSPVFTLEELYNAGTVSGQAAAGGLIGTESYPITVANAYNVGLVSTESETADAGGVCGTIGANINLLNVYSAGAVYYDSADTMAAGSILTGTAASASYTSCLYNVYYLSALEGDLSAQDCYYADDAGFESYDIVSDTHLASMAKSSEDLAALAGTLGDAFTANGDGSYHGGYPILSWENAEEGNAEIYDVDTSGLTFISLSGENAATATEGETYTATLVADDCYALPDTVTVTVGGTEISPLAEYTYDAESGALTIHASAVTGTIAITATGVEDFPEPDQDESGNYLLYTEIDVLWLRSQTADGMADLSAVVMADITMPDTFTGIGTETYAYTGTFDGNGHTVTVDINSDVSAGLFAYVNGAVIKNLTVAGSVTSTVSDGTGGLVGRAGTDGVTVENCVNRAAVTSTSNAGYYVGGIAGYATAASITNASNYGEVSGGQYIGGILGRISMTSADDSGVISGCLNYGAVTGTGNYVGGIVGYAVNSYGSVQISQCGNEGQVAGLQSCGGIAGYLNYSSSSEYAESLYNAGAVSGRTYIGGIIGNVKYGSLINVYNVGTVSAAYTSYNPYAGGIVGYNTTTGNRITNAYGAGSVILSGKTLYGGLIVSYNKSMYAANVYYLGTAELQTTINGDKYLYLYDEESGSWAKVSTDQYSAMSKTAEELTALASVLGDGFKDNGNSEYHNGYPVLSWEETGETEEELQITSQPEDYTGSVGETAVFEVEATGSGLTYQWQYSSNGGTAWHDSGLTGADTAAVSVPITSARDGQQYRCVVTDQNGDSVTSDAATLSLSATAFAITLQPEDYTGLAGTTAAFTVEADGTGLTYQWQYSSNGGTTWHDSSLTGADTASLSVTLKESRDGQQYRCVVTDGDGNTVTSDAATLSLASAGGIVISTQPSDYAGTLGDKVTFTVEATGDTDLSYQWQYSSNGGTTWHDSGMTGADTASLSVYLTSARDGQQYRCVITDEDGCMAVTDVVTMSIAE